VFARILWCAACLGLGSATWLTWQHRFVEAPGKVRLMLEPRHSQAFRAVRAARQITWAADGRAFLIRATAEREHPTLECSLDGLPASRHVWIRLRARCEGVVKGLNRWDEARAAVFWKDAGGRIQPKQAPLCAMEGTCVSQVIQRVVPLPADLGTPALSFQNLGSAGTFHVEELEIRAVNDQPWFRPLMTGLTLAWCAWAAFGFRCWLAPGAGRIAVAAAAMAWVALAWFFLFPGPWYPLRPLTGEFVVAEPPAGASSSAGTSASQPPRQRSITAVTVAAGEILLEPARGKDPVALLFAWKKHIRPLMHIGAYAAMVIGLFVLLGTSRAWLPVAVLALGSEIMQWLWGFGFDRLDALDLAIDAAGVMVGVLVVRGVKKRLSVRKSESLKA
jgi:hypothetical protein